MASWQILIIHKGLSPYRICAHSTRGEKDNESIDVLQLCLTCVTPRWTAHNPGRVLCDCGCHGNCRPATCRLYAANSLSTSARDANGGDIAVMAQGAPLKTSDLAFFSKLKDEGIISNYTAISSASGTLSNGSSAVQSFNVEAVDPNNFPVVSQPSFVEPENGTLAQILTNNQVVVTQNFLAAYHKQVGDTFQVYVRTITGTGQQLTVKIAGVIANMGTFVQAGNLLLISAHDYQASAPATLANYTLVDITTTDQAHSDTAARAINTTVSAC